MIEIGSGAVKTSRHAVSLPRKAKVSSKFLKIILWLFVPIVMWWAFKDVSISEIGKVFQQVSFSGILILIGLNAIIFLLFSSRWWLILSAQGYRRSYFALTGYRLASFGVTYFTPGPQFGGEPLQVYLLKQRENMPTEVAAASVAVDKLLELIANFSFLMVGVMVVIFNDVLSSSTRAEILILPASLLVLPLSYLVALWHDRHPISWISGNLVARFPRWPRLKLADQAIIATEDQVARFCKQNPFALLAAALLSIFIWVLMVYEFSLMLQFLGVHVNIFQVVTALTAARIAFLLPLPAGLGSLEAGQVMAMGLIGVNPVLGLSLSLFIRIRDVFLGGIGLGLGGLLSR
jgi:uncharacterized protein (TIRG00374 family)